MPTPLPFPPTLVQVAGPDRAVRMIQAAKQLAAEWHEPAYIVWRKTAIAPEALILRACERRRGDRTIATITTGE